MARFRNLKKKVREALNRTDWEQQLFGEDEALQPLVGPLFGMLLDKEELVRWRAAEALGACADRMAQTRMEQARVLMRQFMWRMNEESGNLGWGVPESMACAMARNERLANEYHTILASYIYCDEACDGNYLDHPPLRTGVFWALGRLAQQRPEKVEHAERFILCALEDADAGNRGMAAWALGILRSQNAVDPLSRLTDDTATLRIYRNDAVEEVSVGQLAREALRAIGA